MRFFESYVATLLGRDIPELSAVRDRAAVAQLLEAIAAVFGSELNLDGLGRRLGSAATTLRAHADLLEMLFLIERLPPWIGNLFARAIKAPKAYVHDTGLLMNLIGADAERLVDDDAVAGAAFETFAAAELMKQASWNAKPLRLFHYRDRDQREVDLILERLDGTIAAVEVKASANVGARDARGLSYLRDRVGDRFTHGVVLYTGAATLPLGDRITAVPMSGALGVGGRSP